MSQALFSLPRFTDDDAAREHLEALRWPNGAVCPHCGGTERNSRLAGESHRAGLWFCGDCRSQFTVTVGTVFERSKVPLHKWVLATHLICSSKKGMSAHQLHRTLGVTYKTAWFMAHRIREAMGDDAPAPLCGSGAPVEVDETYWGNKKRKGAFKATGSRGAGPHHQMKVVSLIERGGKARSFQFQTIHGGVLRETLRKHITASATVHTDESSFYKPLHRIFAKHETVSHRRGEYSRDGVTTNSVEGFFSILKRGLVGTFHHVGEQHLFRYMKEFDFRYNTRTALGVTDDHRTDEALKGISGKRLTYRRANAQA
ncbi:MAG: IS1595 family transposase [Betaproteobacteria bacterium]|nr:IS1595 family transposase [Betaproteobacteria bacterium]